MTDEDSEFIAEMRGEFLENVPGEIDECEGCLLNFEKSGNEAQLTEYKRLIHSMKGGGRMVALNDFSNHVHNLETALSKCAGPDQMKDFVAFALPFLDQLKVYVSALKDESGAESASTKLTEMIKRWL